MNTFASVKINYLNYSQLLTLCTNFVNGFVKLFNAIVCSYDPFEFGHKEHDN